MALIIGVMGIFLIEGHSLTNGLYFSVCYLSSVGYGDFSFKTTAGKYFAIFWLASSIPIVNRAIDIIHRHIDHWRVHVLVPNIVTLVPNIVTLVPNIVTLVTNIVTLVSWFNGVHRAVLLWRTAVAAAWALKKEAGAAAEQTEASSLCSSPVNHLELTEECALDGEVDWSLNPVPHIPRINGEIPAFDEATSDHQRLLDRLQIYGFRERKVEGHGNFQFRALSDQLYDTPDHHRDVRSQVVNQLKSHPEIYKGYVPMAYDDYLEKMSSYLFEFLARGALQLNLTSRRLQIYGFRERKVEGDGNFQFRALSDQLYDTPDHHKEVRSQVVNQLKSHPEIYKGYVPMAYDDYLEKMSRNGEWGDHVSLLAAANSYGVKIFVRTSFKYNCCIEILHNIQSSKPDLVEFC